MKTSIKYTVCVLFVALLSISGFSQENRFGVTYNTALPLGNTADFVDNYSFRGFGMEGRYEVSPDLYVGFSGAWNVFYASLDGSFTRGTRTLTGKQYRYANTLPLMVTVFKHFDNNGSVVPYLGTGIGTIYSNYRTEMGLFAVEDKGWQFGLAPEIGILFPTVYGSAVMFNVKYNIGFETTELETTSALGINIGLLF